MTSPLVRPMKTKNACILNTTKGDVQGVRAEHALNQMSKNFCNVHVIYDRLAPIFDMCRGGGGGGQRQTFRKYVENYFKLVTAIFFPQRYEIFY